MTREDILAAAQKCVCGDRDKQYGTPENSFRVIGQLWEHYLKGKYGTGEIFILPQDVAAMMTLFKIGRVATGHNKTDNWVDAAGYAACGGELEG